MTLATAATKYDINIYTARDYLRLYKASENLTIPAGFRTGGNQDDTMIARPDTSLYDQMTREELVDELIKARIETERAKKGYEVKGDGRNKVFTSINSKNSKS